MKKSLVEKMMLSSLDHQLKAARHLADMQEILQQFLRDRGITTYSFTYYSYYTNALNQLKYDISSDNFAPWHQHYISEHYEEIDTTLAKIYCTTRPAFWDLPTQLQEATSPKEKQMRLDSIAFGAEKGLCIPIHGPHEDFANFLVVQMRGETCLADWQALQYELFVAGYYYYSYLQNHLLKAQQGVDKYQLNQREIQCLSLIAKQYSPAAIAKSLHITERTVNYHIQRLNKKLGTKNKYQSLAKALQKGLIKN